MVIQPMEWCCNENTVSPLDCRGQSNMDVDEVLGRPRWMYNVFGYPIQIADPARDFKGRAVRYAIVRNRVSVI